jgi:hypothetical protein
MDILSTLEDEILRLDKYINLLAKLKFQWSNETWYMSSMRQRIYTDL